MLKPLYLDTATGAYKAQSSAPKVFDFDVASDEGQTQFEIAPGFMTGSSYVEVLVNGRGEMREGAEHDFERDAGNNLITFNYTVPKQAWVRVKVYPFQEVGA